MKKVLVHGCFDVIHFGHLKHFEEAKRFGDHLTVSVTSDRYVNKGPGRPYFSLPQRVAMLKSLSMIDEVVVSDHPTAIEVIKEVCPRYYVKGPDYKDFSKDVTGGIYEEKKAVESVGGELVFTEDITFSSSAIINKFLNTWTEEQKKTIELVKAFGGIDAIEISLKKARNLNVTTIGEPIIDVYRFVEAQGLSSKSPTVSARLLYETEYDGGALAINRSIQNFARDADYKDCPAKRIRKIRYIQNSTRIFELTDEPQQFWESEEEQNRFLEETHKRASTSDLILVADFGHGMINDHFLKFLENTKNFIALNVQTNSSNYGFNLFKKHKRFDYLCIDTREARLAMHDRVSPPLKIASNIKESLEGRALSITLGANGAALFPNNAFSDPWMITSPAFSDGVIDPIGAGDAYFMITSLLLKTDCPREIIPFVGCVYGGLKCKVLGNGPWPTPANLLKACAAILK